MNDEDFGSGIEHLVKSLAADEPVDVNMDAEHGPYPGDQCERETRSASITTYEPLEAESTGLHKVSYAVNATCLLIKISSDNAVEIDYHLFRSRLLLCWYIRKSVLVKGLLYAADGYRHQIQINLSRSCRKVFRPSALT